MIITNYETWSLTDRCLRALAQVEPSLDSIVVVDDASADPPPPLQDRVRLIRNSTNQGLVRSLNTGIAAANSDISVIFDSDAAPTTPFVAHLQAAFEERPQLGAVAFSTIDRAGRATASTEPEPDAFGLVLGQRLDGIRQRWRVNRQAPFNIFTCAMAVRTSAFRAAGGFDPEFDWLDLDHDLSMRLRRAGWDLALLPGITAIHEGGGAPQKTARRVARFYENRWRLLKKFDLLRHPTLTRTLISWRLRVELMIATVSGAADKAESRRNLLRMVSNEFR